MTVYLTDILQKPSIEDQASAYWRVAKSLGFPVEKLWDYSNAKIMVKALFAANDYMYYFLQQAGLNLTNFRASSGKWLDILAAFYDVERSGSIATSGPIYITPSVAGISTITLLCPNTGVTYVGTNTDTTTTTSRSIAFTANTVGPIGNQALSALSCQTANVTIDASNLTDQTWITAYGADPDTDGQLKQKCANKMTATGCGSSSQLLAYLLKAGTSGAISRSRIYRSSTYAVSATVASFSGVASSSQVSACQSISDTFSAPNEQIVVSSASLQPIVIGGTFSFSKGSDKNQVSRILSGLKSWLESLDISDGSDLSSIASYQFQHQLNVLDSGNIMNDATVIISTGYDQKNMATFLLTPDSSITRYENTIFSATVGPSVVYQ
jgi:hypothetical protein